MKHDYKYKEQLIISLTNYFDRPARKFNYLRMILLILDTRDPLKFNFPSIYILRDSKK